MAYYVIKRVKGRAYLYSQESYRIGAEVKTKSVFLGAVNSETGELLQKDLNDSELVQKYQKEVRDRILIAGDPRESPRFQNLESEGQTGNKTQTDSNKTGRGISPFLQESLRQKASKQYSRLKIKIDCEAFAISKFSLEEDENKNRERLHKISILADKAPRVSIEYGKSLRVYKSGFSGGYVVTIPKRSKGNREHLRREYRRGLALSFLDAVERERKDLFSVLVLEFDASFQETQKLLGEYISATNEYNRLPKEIALKYFGMLAPIANGKLKPSKIGVAEYGRRRNWRDEAVGLMADIQRRGWDNIYSESIAEANKAGKSLGYIIEDKNIWGERERKALRRAELRELLNREKGEKMKILRKILKYR